MVYSKSIVQEGFMRIQSRFYSALPGGITKTDPLYPENAGKDFIGLEYRPLLFPP
jgi:hypothetical protein